MHTLTIHRFDTSDPRLGRHVHHDSRSLEHEFLPRDATPKRKDTLWDSGAGPLNQGDVGSCHDPETEVLTRNGWLPFVDLTMNNELATVDPVTHEISYERPTRVIAKHYSGDMHYLEGRGHNFAVTADHMMLVRKWDERSRQLATDYIQVPMEKVGWYAGLMTSVHQTAAARTYTIPGISGYKRASQRTDLTVDMADWLRFLGIYLAEGTMIGGRKSPNKIQIAAAKTREKSFVRGLLARLGVRALELHDRFSFDNARIYHALESLGLKGVYASEKFVPRFVFEQSSEMIECLLQGHREGDGSLHNGQWTHHTSSPQLADDLQELAFLAGYKTGASVRAARTSTMRDGRVVCGIHPEYTVRALKGSLSSIERRNVRVAHYEGQVYCAEVPTHHTLVTRRRGKILISGNCTGNATAQWLNTNFANAVRPVAPKSETKLYAGGYLTEKNALAIYHMGTVLDTEPGTYPPDDTGCDGVHVAQAAEKLGWLDKYSHTFSFKAAQAAIELSPAIQGTVWTNQMFNPHNGLVKVGRLTDSNIAGGHEYLMCGIDWTEQVFIFRNSWGDQDAWPGCKPGGYFAVGFKDEQALLAEQGDVTILHGKGQS